MLAQSKWKGQGRFVLIKKNNDPSTRAWISTFYKDQKRRQESQDGVGQDSEWVEQTSNQIFIVCIHNVSDEQKYTILQAPVTSTSQDVISQVSQEIFNVLIII